MWKCFVAILFIGTCKQAVADFALEECTFAGHPDKVDQVTEATKNFWKCAIEIQNATRLERLLEIDQSQSNASDLGTKFMDIVHSVCVMKTEIKTCYTDYYDGTSPCFETLNNGKTNKKLLGKLIDYVCYNDSSRLAESVKDGAISCFKENSGSLLPSIMRYYESLKRRLLSKACNKYKLLTTRVGEAFNKHCHKRSISDYVTGYLNIIGSTQCSDTNVNKNGLFVMPGDNFINLFF